MATDDAEVAQLRQLLEFAQRDAGYADELRARLAAVERERDAAKDRLWRFESEVGTLRGERERNYLAAYTSGVDARFAVVVAEQDAALARIAAVEAQAAEVHGHGADDERAEVERLRGIISRIAVLAASPTPTGPEPAKRPCCARPGWCACDPLTPGDEHCQWFGPATPEPTEETR